MLEPAKKTDQELLYEIGETITALVKLKTPRALDLAESLIEDYLKLQHKIKTHDYSSQNQSLIRLYEAVKQLSTGI